MWWIDPQRDRLVIFASTLGTVFEWYDFFIYGTLAAVIGKQFFPTGNETAQFLLALASFGVGFGVRPFGAILFGVLGDKLGRKYTFLVTITLMGIATAAVGLVPGYASIGIAAPIILVTLRVLQGLALGGEYGGAAIYVAEHAPQNKRGFYTSFIQAGVIGGFLLSVGVVLASGLLVDQASWEAWGWRIPFLFSIFLLAVSLWVRLKLKESPVFQAMKEAGKTAGNPLKESFRGWQRTKMILVALFGISAGLTVIWYTAQFQALYFLQNSLRIEDTSARIMIGVAAAFSMFWFILFGWLSDRIGRKPPIVVGYALTLLLLFPLFHWMASAANPELSVAMDRNPVTVQGTNCAYNPFLDPPDHALRPRARHPHQARHRLHLRAGAGLVGRRLPGPHRRQRRQCRGSGGARAGAGLGRLSAREKRAAVRQRDPGGHRDHRDRLPFGHDLWAGRGACWSSCSRRGCATLRCRCPIISAPAISADSCRSSANISWRAPAIPFRACGIRSAWSRWR